MRLSIQPFITMLKNARKAMGLSERELANKLGIPQSHLSKIEGGSVNLKLTSFVEMARGLDLEVMLIPRQKISLVKSLIASQTAIKGSDERKLDYTLDNEEDKED